MEQYSVKTPAGEITVMQHPDPNNPGIWIKVNGKELVLVDYDTETKTHNAHIWNKKRHEEGNDPIMEINLDSAD